MSAILHQSLIASYGFSDPGPSEPIEYTDTTWSQSSIYSGMNAASNANMRDGSTSTGTGTNASSPEWIQATLTESRPINRVSVGGGNIPGWGVVAVYLNTASIQVFVSGAWQTVATVSGVTDTGGSSISFFDFSDVTTDRVRLLKNGFLATTEFRLYLA